MPNFFQRIKLVNIICVLGVSMFPFYLNQTHLIIKWALTSHKSQNNPNYLKHTITNGLKWIWDLKPLIKVCREQSRYSVFLIFFHQNFPRCSQGGGGSSAGAGWQKTAVCLSSSSAVRCPGTSSAQRSAPLWEGNIWYQLLNGRGSPHHLSRETGKAETDSGRAHHPSKLKEKVTLRWCGAVPRAGWRCGVTPRLMVSWVDWVFRATLCLVRKKVFKLHYWNVDVEFGYRVTQCIYLFEIKKGQ